jgi:hypothetical protein
MGVELFFDDPGTHFRVGLNPARQHLQHPAPRLADH